MKLDEAIEHATMMFIPEFLFGMIYMKKMTTAICWKKAEIPGWH